MCARPAAQSPVARDGITLLGVEIARARRVRRMTIAELAERAGVSVVTVRNVERGAPSVAIGTVFEVAVILGLDLFGGADEVAQAVERAKDRLALLPSRVREEVVDLDDDF